MLEGQVFKMKSCRCVICIILFFAVEKIEAQKINIVKVLDSILCHANPKNLNGFSIVKKNSEVIYFSDSLKSYCGINQIFGSEKELLETLRKTKKKGSQVEVIIFSEKYIFLTCSYEFRFNISGAGYDKKSNNLIWFGWPEEEESEIVVSFKLNAGNKEWEIVRIEERKR